MRQFRDPPFLSIARRRPVTAFALLALVAFAIGLVIAYRLGASRARAQSGGAAQRFADAQASKSNTPIDPVHTLPTENIALPAVHSTVPAEHNEASAALPQLRDFAEDRRRLLVELAAAREELARYREIVVDIERNAPPPLLDAPGTPDDLKLIVGVGPVIERMLYQLGIATYRQIAHWSDRDIDAFDARLSDFPGRIRRDQWVTQARALHTSKYGTAP
jgi:predicted flap endonuclease-1-like 5' DNA nuclease